jgi:hypothetical protein
MKIYGIAVADQTSFPRTVEYSFGNAVEDGQSNGPKGWFIGHFVEQSSGLRHSAEVEVKWGVHEAGDRKTSLRTNEHGTTLTLLVSGRFQIGFPELRVEFELDRPGDYVLFAAGVAHTWRALSACTVLTVRWPSIHSL